MAMLPPFLAKLTAPDGFAEQRYFSTQAAIKWLLHAPPHTERGSIGMVGLGLPNVFRKSCSAEHVSNFAHIA